jgi:hypothetical protein
MGLQVPFYSLGTFKGFRVSHKSTPLLELGCFYIDHFLIPCPPLSFQMLLLFFPNR